MRTLALSLGLFAALAAFASEDTTLSFADLLKDVTVEQPLCFGREYAAAHLRARPLQTVRLFRAKLSKQADTEGSFLSVEAVLKGERNEHKLWKQFLVCSDNGTCAVECDGGSVSLASLRDGSLSLRNNRFVLEGACDGGEKKTVFLDNKRGGDDLFELHRLPAEFCAPDSTD